MAAAPKQPLRDGERRLLDEIRYAEDAAVAGKRGAPADVAEGSLRTVGRDAEGDDPSGLRRVRRVVERVRQRRLVLDDVVRGHGPEDGAGPAFLRDDRRRGERGRGIAAERLQQNRSADHSVGKEGVRTGSARWWPRH